MTPPRAGDGGPPADVEPLAADMAARWAAGDRPLTEEYLDRSPDLWHHPDAALELIAEELALRAEYGEPVLADALTARFPKWRAQVLALYEYHELLGPTPVSRFPSPGETLGDFRLRSELGRGSHARVYLASQGSLGGRPVVLKVGPATGGEHLSLARLQHTHIVPLYSAHEFPARGLRALCLPYFGGTPLSALLAARAVRPGPVAGKDLLTDPADGEAAPGHGPARGFLARASWAEAVCWVGACLADALEYAHARGLLHLDLKPSNVLVAADGTPMLLDFHLARPPLAAGAAAPDWVGGTPGYMPPEQAAALAAVRAGEPVPAGVDARADVYALGVVLSEALRAVGDRAAVPVGLSDVLARCTAPAAADRYPSAAALAADLRRHLSDLPLRGVGNRSLAERWGKWRRRRPYALPLALTLAAAAAMSGGLAMRADRQAERGRAALRDGEAHLARGRFAEAAEAFRAGEALVDGIPFEQSLRARLAAGRRAAAGGRAAADLHGLCDRVRPLYAAAVVPPDQLRAAEGLCHALWDRRAEIAGLPDGRPNDRLRDDLLDLAILTADLGGRAAPPDQAAAAHRRAVAILDEADGFLGPSGVLDLERARHARAAGLGTVAVEAGRRAAVPPRRPWEHLAAGRALLAQGEAHRAAAELDLAVTGDPQSVWANYYQGACRLQLGEPAKALAAFAAAAALAPDSAWCVYNRGLAYLETGQTDPALADFDRALALDPGLSAVYLGRAAAYRRVGRYADGLADLGRAAAAGLPAGEVGHQRALLFLGRKDRPAAVAALREGLARDPDHRPSRDLLARLTHDPKQPVVTGPELPP